VSDAPWAASVAALSRFYIGAATLEETLTRVSELAVEAIGPAEFVGLTMMVEGRQRTAIFTDKESPEIDQAQYDSGEGPCVEATEKNQPFTIESTLTESRWPAFCLMASSHGILSTLSLPMMMENGAVGAMNFYARTESAFSPATVAQAEPFAAQAAIVLANSHAYWDARALGERLSQAIEHRSAIEQAKGILMATQGCDADAAFDLLVAGSQRENVKVRDLAERIVTRATKGENR
jgi:GAF domain-containing protein